MNKKKIIINVLISVCMVVALIWAGIYAFKPFMPDDGGVITVEVMDVDGNVLKVEEVTFMPENRLRDLLAIYFTNFSIEESEYGAYVVSIDAIAQDNDNHIYIALYLNDEYSESGIDTLVYKDGDVLSFRATRW